MLKEMAQGQSRVLLGIGEYLAQECEDQRYYPNLHMHDTSDFEFPRGPQNLVLMEVAQSAKIHASHIAGVGVMIEQQHEQCE